MFTRVVTLLVIGLALVGWSAAVVPATAAAAASGHAGGGHGSEQVDLNPLAWNSDLAIWTAVVFVVLLLVLWKFAWRPIAEGLDKREQRIAEDIAGAERSNAEARDLLDEYQQKLSASGEDVRQMLEAARRDAQQVGAEIVDKARSDAQTEHRRALREIDLATAAALEELAGRSASLAVELAGKIVGVELRAADHTRLVEQAVAGFAADKGNGKT